MNLQVCAPHQECVYNCPFCVALGHKHKYQFKDIYNDGLNQDYFNALKRTIKTCNIDTVIITGECDPTQNMRWARKVAEVAKSCGVRTEIQTHNLSMKMEQLDFVDVVSYSVTNAREYLSSWQCINNYHGNAISRMVIILTKELNFLNKNNFCRMGFDQVTFKSLNYGEDEKINKWIDENTIELDQWRIIPQNELIKMYNDYECPHPDEARKWNKIYEICNNNNVFSEMNEICTNEITIY